MAAASVRWLRPDEGGWKSGPPTASVYSATMAFKLDPNAAPGWKLAADPFLSILVKRPEIRGNVGEELAAIGFLAPDMARPYLHPTSEFVILEGPSVVAEAVVLDVIDPADTQGR